MLVQLRKSRRLLCLRLLLVQLNFRWVVVVAEEMPGLSGSQTVQLVRRRVAGAGLPALVLGGEQAAEGTINLAGPITSKRFCKAMKQLLRTQS